MPNLRGIPFDAPPAKNGLRLAAGIIFVAPDGDVLLLRRSAEEKNYGGHWGLPGGCAEGGETAEEAAVRECREEIQHSVAARSLRLIDRVVTPNNMQFTTFVQPTEDKFVPVLDHEHTGFCWASVHQLPGPLHPSVKRVLGEHIGVAEDMKPEDWDALRKNFAKWTREEEKEPEHLAADAMAFDWASAPRRSQNVFAFDFQSTRSIDADGHLHLLPTPVSKANVCEYYGWEIPDGGELGLVTDKDLNKGKKYRLLRDPGELAKAAVTLNGKPLLITHASTDADDHQTELVVGTTGTDARYEDPYLKVSLSVWEGSAIAGIESGARKELSSAYRYRADMTPGIYLGVPYDGVMRDISFNHVALVPAGRAGADVVVGDAMPEPIKPTTHGEVIMKTVLSRKGLYLAAGVAALMAPRMAQDAKLDTDAIFAGVTNTNLPQKKPGILAALRAIPLANDQKVDDVLLAFDKMEKEEVPEGADADPNSGLPLNKAEMDKKAKDEFEAGEKKKADDKKASDKKARDAAFADFKKGKDEKTCAALDEMMSRLDGMDGESERANENESGKEKGGGEDAKGMDKKAMDEAIAASETRIRGEMKAIAEAREFVEPWVGKVGLAFDSADEVYKTALDGLKVDITGVHSSALKAVLAAQPKPGSQTGTRELAMDAALDVDESSTSGRFGAIDRIAAA